LLLLSRFLSFKQELTRISATTNDTPIKQTFLVGTIPCMIKFSFVNDYSWMREKIISYRITVTPPSSESLLQSRTSRAQTCLTIVEKDLHNHITPKLKQVQDKKTQLQDQITALQKQLQDLQMEYKTTEKEESMLQQRKGVRIEQERLLKQRLQQGWKDGK
jgi:hypothetical protein